MTYKVEFTRTAEQDLRDVYEYVAYELGEPQAAARLISNIREATDSLSTYPERRPLVDFEPWRSRNTRWVLVGRHLVFYTKDRQRRAVSVLRILYGGRDAEAEMNRMLEEPTME